MAWDSKRPVPWRRIGILLGIYGILFFTVTAIGNRKHLGGAALSIVVGMTLTGTALVVLAKFGWTMPMLKNRQQLAEERAIREAARAESRGGSKSRGGDDSVPGPKPRPAPTRRTSTGPSQHPRRTTDRRR